MKGFRKWFANFDSALVVLGAILIYFSESIVTFFYPLDPVPSGVISILMYLTMYSVAAFFLLNGLVYYTIKLYWVNFYDYFEGDFKEDFAALTKLQKVCISVFFYLGLLLAVAIIFASTTSSL